MNFQIIVITTAVLMFNIMPTISTRQWGSLEQWTDTVFFVAGASFFLATVLLIINRFFGGIGSIGQIPGGVFYAAGLMSLPVGLLGFYPRVNEQSPRLALFGVAAAALAVLGYVGAIVLTVLTIALATVSLPAGGFALLSLVLVLIGFLVFGGISVLSGVPSRTVGVLLLGIVAAFGGYVVVFAFLVTNPPDWIPATAGGTFTVITLAIGYVLRTESQPAGRTEPTPTGGSS